MKNDFIKNFKKFQKNIGTKNFKKNIDTKILKSCITIEQQKSLT